MFVVHPGWGQHRFDGLPQRPVSMPTGPHTAQHDASSTASRMSAESSSESEAHSVSSLGKGTNGNKEAGGAGGSKDKKSGMFRFLSKKKRSSQPPN